VSIREHTSAYVSIRLLLECGDLLLHVTHHLARQHTSAYVSIRQQTSAYASIRQHRDLLLHVTHHLAQCAHVRCCLVRLLRQHASAYVSIIRQHTSAYVSIRQHTSAYVSIRAQCLHAPLPRPPACAHRQLNQLRIDSLNRALIGP
jgi:isocitrate/isopropylmalate dehydrogenase